MVIANKLGEQSTVATHREIVFVRAPYGMPDARCFRLIEAPMPVPAGGLLLMHPLLLHASSPASQPGHRRVIHLEYAAESLPGQLEWYERHGGSSTRPNSRLTRLGRRLVTV